MNISGLTNPILRRAGVSRGSIPLNRERDIPATGPRLVQVSPVWSPPSSATAPLPVASGAPWRAISLFSGGGGLDLGFLAEGVLAQAAYDNSRGALRSYIANLPGDARLADLSRYEPEDRCDVLLAGAPCQGFSTAGRRLEHDPRNGLLARVGDIALKLNPKVIVVENVPAALSGPAGHHWRGLENRLRLHGYSVARLTLAGEDSGVAQRRRRLFMLCWKGLPETTLRLDQVEPPPLRSVLAIGAEVGSHRPRWPAPTSVAALIARRIGHGQKLCNVRCSPSAVPTWSVPEVFGQVSGRERDVLAAVAVLRRRDRRRSWGDGDPVLQDRLDDHLGRPSAADVARLVDAGYLRLLEGGVELRHTYNGKYRRLSWDDVSPTVDTHFGRMALFMHPDEDRGLTVREAARIQGFPDAYEVYGRESDQFETIGNAVPPPMASRVARLVREALLKR